MAKENIAIFASGSGTNAEEFFRYFKDHPSIQIATLLSNNPQAFALERARNHGIDTLVFSSDDFYRSGIVLDYLSAMNISFIVLAGFMWLIPKKIVDAYENHLVNIHPALLPKFGGKGLYGHHVHNAVIENKEKESGITIHYVNNRYDEGKIIFQAKCEVMPNDTPDTLASRIHGLEYEHFPKVVESVILGS